MNLIDKEELYEYLKIQYTGVFDDKRIEQHIKDYIGPDTANIQVKLILHRSASNARILDIGSGFGSFVLAARQAGFDAIGIDTADFEIRYARKRLNIGMPDCNPEYVFRKASALELPFESGSFDIVTMWNLLEHTPDSNRALTEASRVVKNNGYLYIVSPNYASFRKEAHYHILWFPFFTGKPAQTYLRICGKDAGFFKNNIFYCTNLGVLNALKKQGMKVYDMLSDRISNRALVRQGKTKRIILLFERFHLISLLKLVLKVNMYNPFKKSIMLVARKEV